jgi:hypothetical protein
MLYMTRKIEAQLKTHLTSQNFQPILVNGARRVGKSSTIAHVCNQLFGKNAVTLDFQTNLSTISQIFSAPTNDVDNIVARIAEYTQTSINKASSVIFFDEVQLDERALNSLRFFSDSGWRVVASGSLLGVTTKQRSLPFPSGVKHLTMHPMDFEEFLWACGREQMASDIKQHAQTGQSYILHDTATELFERYLVIGGMPLAVRTFVETGNFERVAEVQDEINATYTADMTDTQNGISGISAKRIWDSLPKQLLRASTKKFKYSEVVRGGRRERLLEPLEWLRAAGICTINDLTCQCEAPLFPWQDENGSYFKVYVADTGIMFHKFGISAAAFLDPSMKMVLSSDFRGALAENFVQQQLAAADLQIYYWMRTDKIGNGEIDFVFQTPRGEIIPVEVKSGRNVSAKSMNAFMKQGRAKQAYRLSAQNFAVSQKAGWQLMSMPLYAAFAINQQ